MDKYLKSFLLKLQQLDNKMQTLLSFKKERKIKVLQNYKTNFLYKIFVEIQS